MKNRTRSVTTGIITDIAVILSGGMIQAAALCIISAFLFFFTIFLPPKFEVLEGFMIREYLTAFLCLSLGSVIAGRIYPRFASWRGAASFLCIVALDAYRFFTDQSSMFLWTRQYTPIVLLMALLGILFCYVGGAIGSTNKTKLAKFIQDELDEFYESIGMGKEKSRRLHLPSNTRPSSDSGRFFPNG